MDAKAYNPLTMLLHTIKNLMAIHRKIRTTHAALWGFLDTPRATRKNPWTDEEAQKHRQLT